MIERLTAPPRTAAPDRAVTVNVKEAGRPLGETGESTLRKPKSQSRLKAQGKVQHRKVNVSRLKLYFSPYFGDEAAAPSAGGSTVARVIENLEKKVARSKEDPQLQRDLAELRNKKSILEQQLFR